MKGKDEGMQTLNADFWDEKLSAVALVLFVAERPKRFVGRCGGFEIICSLMLELLQCRTKTCELVFLGFNMLFQELDLVHDVCEALECQREAKCCLCWLWLGLMKLRSGRKV